MAPTMGCGRKIGHLCAPLLAAAQCGFSWRRSWARGGRVHAPPPFARVAPHAPHIGEAVGEGASLDRSRQVGDGVSSTGMSPAAIAHLTTS